MTLPKVPLLQQHTATALTLHSLVEDRRLGGHFGQGVFDHMGLCEDAFGLFMASKGLVGVGGGGPVAGRGSIFRSNGVYLVVWVGSSLGDQWGEEGADEGPRDCNETRLGSSSRRPALILRSSTSILATVIVLHSFVHQSFLCHKQTETKKIKDVLFQTYSGLIALNSTLKWQ